MLIDLRDDLLREISREHPMSLLGQYIDQQGFVVLDGALATELERHGADLADPLWSARCLVESPELITKVHWSYLEAGADVITTSSYQASVAGFRARGFDDAGARALMRLSIELAVNARDEFWAQADSRAGRLKPLVAVSMGPFGACLHDGSEYHGRYRAGWDEVAKFHRNRLQVLAGAGGDLLAFETIPSLPEAEILLDALEAHAGEGVWISFSCRNETEVSHGEGFADCARLVAGHPRVVATGVNCTDPRYLIPLLESAKGIPRSFVVYPNRGETWHAAENCWKGAGAEQLDATRWFDAGARLIGGCCRTTPEDIRELRNALLNHFARKPRNPTAE